MEKQIFRKGDRVFDIRYGWGKVIDDNKGGLFPIGVQFEDDDSQEVIIYTNDGKTNHGEELPLLSFTEYTLKGFSQERPVNYEECVGRWGKFWEEGENEILISILVNYERNNKEFPFETGNEYFSNFEPLTEEQVRVLNLDDIKNY